MLFKNYQANELSKELYAWFFNSHVLVKSLVVYLPQDLTRKKP